MHTRIVSRAIFTLQIIGRAAIIITSAMIFIVIGASIYEAMGTMH